MQNKLVHSVVQKRNDESLNRIREHPFIVQAHVKKLTKSQSERWILCAGRESYSFPKILENMVERCTNPKVVKILRENLDDENGNGNPEKSHFKHYLYLLDNLGIARSTFDNYNERAGIKLALSLAYNVSIQPDEGFALGYRCV